MRSFLPLCRAAFGRDHRVSSIAVVVRVATSVTAESQLTKLKAQVEGVYSLEEWHLATGAAQPPHVAGRFVLLNGTVVTLLRIRIQEANQTTVASYGTYTLDPNRFAYKYDDTAVYAQTASGITVSNKLPFEGLRGFAVVTEDNAVRFRSDTGNQEFLFAADRLSYSENGKVQRVWKRVVENQ